MTLTLRPRYGPCMRWFCGLALLAFGLSGCWLFKKETPRTHPLELIRKDADVVVEFRDISMLSGTRAEVNKLFSGVISAQQVQQFQKELTLAMGFDPTTKEGLEGVGLATEGAAAAEVLADGTGSVWVLPVAKYKTLGPVIETVMKARGGADEAKRETRDGVSVTVLSGEYGPQTVVRAAHAEARGHVILGFGPQAADLVVAAARREKKDAIRHHPNYRALAARLGDAYDLRLVSPRGGEAISAALARLVNRDLGRVKPLLDRMTAAGWILRLADGALSFRGRARLDENGMKKVKAVFAVKGKAPKGVKAVNLPDAVLVAQGAGDPRALLELLAPVGSPQRGDLDRSMQKVKSDLDIDIMADVVPNFSGHATLAVGTGDLTDVEFKEIVGNPLGQLWTAFAASAKDAKALAKSEMKLNERLKERQVEVRVRTAGDAEVREIIAKLPDGEKSDALFATFNHGEAWGFSVEPVIVDRILENDGVDALDGAPGIFAELRVARLGAELRRFKIRELPVVYRAVVFKILDYLSLVERLTVRVGPSEDGAQMQGELRFSSGASRAP